MIRRVIACLFVILMMMAGGVAPTSAAVAETTVSRTHFDEDVSFICTSELTHVTGEIQVVTGEIQVVSHTTGDGAGKLTIVQQSNFVRFSGTGLESGQRYAAVGSAYGISTTHIDSEFPTIFTSVSPARVIAQGQPNPGQVFTFQYTTHTTINANGVVVVEFAHYSEECL